MSDANSDLPSHRPFRAFASFAPRFGASNCCISDWLIEGLIASNRPVALIPRAPCWVAASATRVS